MKRTPLHRESSYDLRIALCDHPDFTGNALRGGFIRRFSKIIRRHILLLASLLVFSGCASVIDMTRDLARDLSDIDVAGMTGGLLGAETIQLSPEQTAQLATVPRAQPAWRNGIEESTATVLSPIFENGAVYAAGMSGRLVRFDPATGKQTGNVDTRHQLSGGVGSGNGMLLVGTLKGEVLAYSDKDGKALWKAQVSTEILSPPKADGGIVVVRTGDGRIFGLDADSGKRKWIYQGATPALTVRSFAGVLISQGMVFAGFAGGKLVAINLSNGSVGWEAVVSRPRGATELERMTDVSSLPVADEYQVCAVAFQGRVACFEIASGNQIWARDASSNAGSVLWLDVSDCSCGNAFVPVLKMHCRLSKMYFHRLPFAFSSLQVEYSRPQFARSGTVCGIPHPVPFPGECNAGRARPTPGPSNQRLPTSRPFMGNAGKIVIPAPPGSSRSTGTLLRQSRHPLLLISAIHSCRGHERKTWTVPYLSSLPDGQAEDIHCHFGKILISCFVVEQRRISICSSN